MRRRWWSRWWSGCWRSGRETYITFALIEHTRRRQQSMMEREREPGPGQCIVRQAYSECYISLYVSVLLRIFHILGRSGRAVVTRETYIPSALTEHTRRRQQQ